MRKIKFRAWHIVDKGWLNDKILSQYLTILKGEFYVPTNVKLMQYSGLKDKNGKEIYEGDIIKETKKTQEGYSLTKLTEYNLINSIEWDNHYASWYFGIIPASNFESAEIIGNTYENPELVKEKESVKKLP